MDRTEHVGSETWHDCYQGSWRGYIVDEAFAHPAKASRVLLMRIFDELFARQLLAKGRIVLDPFGGIGTTGIIATSRGCQTISVELEEKFVRLALANALLYVHEWRMLNLPPPVILQGDSRRLGDVLRIGRTACTLVPDGSLDAVIGSPPYAEIASGAGGLNTKAPNEPGQQSGRTANSPSQDTDQHYGSALGQLSRLPLGSIDAVISSLPYNLPASQDHNGTRGSTRGTTPSEEGAFVRYGNSQGQLEGLSMGSFWEAACAVVRECHALLKPGGTAVWIVKAFVRDKQIVDFPGDWQKLCAHLGLDTFLEVHASLTEEVSQPNLWGGDTIRRTERKSFFRRLAESKGAPRIDHEVVYFMRKR